MLVTKTVDFRPFEHRSKLMAYVGLVPSEHSSGGTRRQGAITKAGNSRARHVLVQAAWRGRSTEAGQENARSQPNVTGAGDGPETHAT